jgi:potassium/sodium efflux P-type ATPase
MGQGTAESLEGRLPEPWCLEIDEVARSVDSDAVRGLAGAEAARRLARYGPNLLRAADREPRWHAVLRQFADPLIYLLVAAVAISLAAWAVEGADGVPYDAVVIALIVLANAVLGYVQEARAERAVEALQRMTASSATVVRDGRPVRVPAADLVPGDLLVLEAGDAVGADARLTQVAALTMTEAALTGESEPVLKDPAPIPAATALADRLDMVFHGTAVGRGRGRALVTATGMSTEMGRVATMLESTEKESTPLQREVGRIGRLLGSAVVVIAVVVTTAIFLTTDVRTASDVVAVLLVGVSLAVAAVPEGLPTILSVVLALGVQRMAVKRAIVKRLSSVETLGSASVICSDKTGTLTCNEMTVRSVVTWSGRVDVTGSGYHPEGDLIHDGRSLDDDQLLREVQLVIGGGSLANDAVLVRDGDDWSIQGDPTEAAFLVAEAKIGLTEARRERFDRVDEVPFTSERKLMSAVATDADSTQGLAVVTKGAPDVLLARCTHEQTPEGVVPLTDVRRTEVLATIDQLADEALRTLGVAYRRVPPGTTAGEALEQELIHLGVVGIIDPARPEARSSLDEARSAGIRVLMITGDHPRTAARIAADLGLTAAGSRVLTGADLDSLSEQALSDTVRDVRVYARVAPEHKLRIVKALQADGEVVAMTGDGVNDAPALKAADIGVAMGRTGTDVSKEAADMVLSDDNFATIVTAVREGRGIFSDIRKFIRFLLSSNIGEVLTMFLGVVLAGPLGLTGSGAALAVPLLATQILWINLLTDSAPALAIGVDPPPDDAMLRPPRRIGDRVIDRDMWVGILWVGAVMALVTLAALDLRLDGGLLGGSGSLAEARTVAFTTLVLAQLFNCLNARSDRDSAFRHLFTNRWLWGAIALSAALQVAVVHLGFLNRAFDTVPLDAGDWALCVGLAALVLVAAEAKKLLTRARLRRTGADRRTPGHTGEVWRAGR